MENPLIRKLESFAALSNDDKRLLDDIVAASRIVDARTDLIREGGTSKTAHLVLDGFACRYKLLKGGKRQIVAYLLPGDVCDIDAVLSNGLDHHVGTISRCKVADIPRDRILDLTGRPALARAFAWATVVDQGILREWLLNIGQRHATARVGHLLCELLFRLRVVGFAEADQYEFPLTQADIGDTMGISFVHVNRCMQNLREMDLIAMKGKRIVIRDLGRLIAFTEFDPNYLHLGTCPAR